MRHRPLSTRCSWPLSVGEHRPGVGFIGRLSENLAVALHHGVAAEDQPAADPPGNVGGLLPGQAGDKLLGRFAAQTPPSAASDGGQTSNS